jgi:hypothetical protein
MASKNQKLIPKTKINPKPKIKPILDVFFHELEG